MDCSECEFLAENEQITIIPSFSSKKLNLISGDVGGFEPGIKVKVPLWLGVSLKKQHKCRIDPPDWLTVARLEELIATEADNHTFAEVPRHFMEVSKILFRCAADDIPNFDQVQVLMKDLTDSRSSKLNTSIKQFVASGSNHAEVMNLTQFEMTLQRPFLTTALDQIRRLQAAENDVGSLLPQGESQSQY